MLECSWPVCNTACNTEDATLDNTCKQLMVCTAHSTRSSAYVMHHASCSKPKTNSQFCIQSYVCGSSQAALLVAAQAVAQLEAATQQVFQENQQLNKQSNLLNTDVGCCACETNDVMHEEPCMYALLSSDVACLYAIISTQSSRTSKRKRVCMFRL